MHKFDEIGEYLMSIARRNREIKQVEAQAELKAIQREYEAYTDGVLDAVRAIKAAAKEADGNG